MAATITLEEVKANPITAGFSDDILNGFIAFVDLADACLDANYPSEDIQKTIKLYGVWYLCDISRIGNVESERDPTGAAVTYAKKSGLSSSAYGTALQALDTSNCVTSLFGQTGQQFIFLAVDGI